MLKSKIHFVSKEELSHIVSESNSYSDVLRKLELPHIGGRTRDVLKEKIKLFGISIGHFKPYSGKRKTSKRLSYDDILVQNSSYLNLDYLKKRLIKDKLLIYECYICKNDGFYNGIPLSLQMDHINGIRTDNRIENLRMLCPNCHTQTETYAAKNIKELRLAVNRRSPKAISSVQIR